MKGILLRIIIDCNEQQMLFVITEQLCMKENGRKKGHGQLNDKKEGRRKEKEGNEGES